jgi:hypothetical protein
MATPAPSMNSMPVRRVEMDNTVAVAVPRC